ncbi:hypothetical protein J6590_002452 [Homalodisca vitripennis]|nr:hypothetical protein J6590_002452 [Homalodisca vitripennis]
MRLFFIHKKLSHLNAPHRCQYICSLWQITVKAVSRPKPSNPAGQVVSDYLSGSKNDAKYKWMSYCQLTTAVPSVAVSYVPPVLLYMRQRVNRAIIRSSGALCKEGGEDLHIPGTVIIVWRVETRGGSSGNKNTCLDIPPCCLAAAANYQLTPDIMILN